MYAQKQQSKLAGIGIAIVVFIAVAWGVSTLKQTTSTSVAQAVPPAVRIQAIYASSSEYWPISGLNESLLSFALRNDGAENILVTGLTVYVSSSPPNANTTSTPALLNYKLRNASTSAQYGTTIWRASPGPTPQYAQVSWRNLSITVPSRGMVPFVVNNDVANVGSALAPFIAGTKHEASLVSSDPVLPVSIIGRGAVSGTGATVSGSSRGGMKTVFASVLHAGLNPTSPRGLMTASSEQIIAKFSLWHEDRGLRSPTVSGWSQITFDSNVTIRSPRTLRIYRDSVTPANLLGTATIPSGLLSAQRPSINLTRWIIAGIQASPSVLVITMDTRDAVLNNWLTARLTALNWTDNFIPWIQPLELPIAANQLRY